MLNLRLKSPSYFKFWLVLLAWILPACRAERSKDSALTFSSGSTRLVYAKITEGTVIGPNIAPESQGFGAEVEVLVKAQLHYAVGYFNGLEGSPSLGSIKIFNLQKLPDVLKSGLAKYSYSAELPVALGKEEGQALVENLELILPAQVDQVFLQEFLLRYQTDCIMGLNIKPTVDNFWYYYRPEAFFCPLKIRVRDIDQSSVVSLKAVITPAKQGTTTYPEYDKLWADGRLRYTGVFTRVEGAFGDIGEESMAAFARQLLASFGEPRIHLPKDLNLAKLQQRIRSNRLDVNELEFEFETPRGILEVHLFLLKDLDKPEESVADFEAKYSTLTRKSGLIVFNGHASYGRDVEVFSSFGNFDPASYHLFVLNACDSFAYEAPRLRLAHREANKAASNPDGYLDLVTNAMPAPAFDMPAINIAFLTAAVQATRSYLEILNGTSESDIAPAKSQRTVVLYDEDNTWLPVAVNSL